MTHYDENFYDNQIEASLASARSVVPIVYKIYKPKTVIDVGCGVGTWASIFSNYECDVYGIDGDYVPRKRLLIEKYIPMDISKPFELSDRFDLAVCLEVAEHLPLERSSSFINDLCKLSDTILFSAATPGQGGTNHINEQPLEFWQNIFSEYGYSMYDCIRPFIKNMNEIAWWYRNNIVVFKKD